MIATLSWLRARLTLRRWRARFPEATIYPGAVLTEGSGLGKHAVLFPNASLQNARLGDFSYAASGTIINNAEVGPFCSIANEVVIGLAAHPTHMASTSPVFYDPAQPLPRFFTREQVFTETLPCTRVGADVWIGQRAMIRAGVTIGHGAVIGAGAMVTRDVAPYSIVVGIPARLLRSRFDDSLCHQLLESRWWELDATRLEELAPFFRDPASLLRALAGRGNP
jgi:acetyltransferase-like isoleucine patch superfamily enzyme